MSKRLALGFRVALAIVFGLMPELTLASAAQRVRLEAARLTPVERGTKSELSKPAKPLFASKFLSKRPAQDPGDTTRLPGETTTLLSDGRVLKIGGLDTDGPVAEVHIQSLRLQMQRSRAWHTATTLPDGKILIVGGIGSNGRVVEEAEIFDPETNTFELLQGRSSVFNPQSSAPTSRVYHTATLLTDGLVLIAGGVSSAGDATRNAQLWDFRNQTTLSLKSKLRSARYNHQATLLPDGNVLLFGGVDSKGNPLDTGELFNVSTRRFSSLSYDDVDSLVSDLRGSAPRPALAGSLPEKGASDVGTDAILALRFSRPLKIETVNADTVTLIGPGGSVDTRIVPAEGGMLAFVTPRAGLLPNSAYALSLNGSVSPDNVPINPATLTFSTSRIVAPSPALPDDEEWIPDERNLNGNWRSNRPDSEWRSLKALQAAPGVTALAGQSLMINGKPLGGVTLQISNVKTKTDDTGRFLLADVPAGHQVMIIDGRSANRGLKSFGVFKVGIEIGEAKTNVLPFTIWMTRLDTAHAVKIPSPTKSDLVVTNRRIPGLELRLPAQTVIRDIDGNNVTEISMTAVPVDRPPFPLPAGINVPVFFTVQPGGSVLIPPRAQIVYPNFTGEASGARINFWNYDPSEKGWYIYGQGTVTTNGKQIVPDPGVVIYEFSGIMISGASRPVGTPPCDCGATDGDPVNLATGLFVLDSTDLLLPDVLSIGVTRTYRPNDGSSYSFGIGAVSQYDLMLYDPTPGGAHWMQAYLILPDGGRIRYDRISPGTSWVDAVLENTSGPTRFYKSRIKWNGLPGWDLTLRDGTVLVWGDAAPLQSIRDRNGNQITISRSNGQSGNITRVTSPNGRRIEFTYDSSNRVTQARDNTGRAVTYHYDSGGRLWKVTDPAGGVTEYTYDGAARMLTIKDARGIVYLTNQYDTNGRVTQQTQADSTTYQFAYTLDGSGKVTQTDVTDPRGNHRNVTFNGDGYRLTDTKGCSCGSGVTYERQPGTNFITSVTDALNRRTEFVYDSMGNVTSITRMPGTSEAVTTTFAYEPAFNQVASVTDALNHTTSFGYDNNGNLTSVSDALNHQTTFTYNSAGQPISVTDPLGNTAQFGYDGGDLVSVTNPLGQAASRFVDSAGRVLSVTNPLGQTARFEYDALNRMTRITDPLQGVTQFSYDANGNLLSLTDARNNLTSYVYDNMDRVQTRTDPLTHSESYQYDQNGSLTQHTDRKSQITNYTYDSLDRLSQATYADTSTITYAYDAVSRLTQVTDSVSGTITYAYDNLDRLLSETTPQGTVSYTYDALGQRATMTVPNQAIVNYSYDTANRLTQITRGLSAVSFAYDAADRRTSLTLPNGVITEYAYNAASQLVGLTYTKGENTLGNLTYDYDVVGRRTKIGGSFARTNLPAAITSAGYNPANQQTAFGSQILAFDQNGNLTSDGTNAYVWNARDELLSISGSVTASFQYDAVGRRRSKTVGGVSTTFLYDGDNAVQEQSSGTANILAGSLDEFFTRSDASGTMALIGDKLGSTVALTDAAGVVQTTYTYEPFGNTTAAGSTNGNTSQFTGRENDGTGSYYYRTRYYSPSLHRFLAEDRLGFTADDKNLYGYVGDDPLNLVDPRGLSAVAKVIRLGKKGFKVIQKVCFKDAVKALEEGEDLIAKNRRTAEEIARAAGGGKAPVHDRKHGPSVDGYRDHYHPHGRPGGHIFYGIAATLAPFSMELSGRKTTTNGQFASAVVWDVACTIDPIGITDAINWFTGLSNDPDE